jgi:hypothetical protein
MAERDVLERLREEWRSLLDAQSIRPETTPLALPRERRMPLSRTALLALLEEVRAAWSDLRESVDEELAGRYVNAGWTLKDLLAHLASWATEFRREVAAAARREELDYAIPFAMGVLGPTQWNEEQVAARRDQGLEAIFDEFARETAALEEIVLTIGDGELYAPALFPPAPSGDPAARFRGPAAFIISAKCLHDRHHIEQIRERLTRFRG